MRANGRLPAGSDVRSLKSAFIRCQNAAPGRVSAGPQFCDCLRPRFERNPQPWHQHDRAAVRRLLASLNLKYGTLFPRKLCMQSSPRLLSRGPNLGRACGHATACKPLRRGSSILENARQRICPSSTFSGLRPRQRHALRQTQPGGPSHPYPIASLRHTSIYPRTGLCAGMHKLA